jgi:uncharacterized protein YbcC (UPF0753/DUF2309 family)
MPPTTLTAAATDRLAAPSPDRAAVETAVARATRRIAPVWPLKHFVAVNPFLGVTDQSFAEAARTVAETADARLTMPRSFYADAIRRGRLTDRHLEQALAEARRRDPAAPLPADAQALRALALAGGPGAPHAVVPTVADVATRVTGQDWARFAVERISFWASAYFDEGQAAWRSPWRDLPPFGAWRAEALIDRAPEVEGATRFRAVIATLPAAAADAISECLARLEVPADALERYLHRLLATIGGWAAYGRYHVWQSELDGDADDTVAQLLAVRLGWEVALLDSLPAVREAWRQAAATVAARTSAAADAALAADCVLQAAYEIGWQEELIAKLGSASAAGRDERASSPDARPAVQAAFCIDVRSEVFRRALESVGDGVETIGFAGFFGFPIEYVPLGMEIGGAQCPVLLTPKMVIAESVHGSAPAEGERLGVGRVVARRAANAWRTFKQGAVSCFGFVSPVGLAFAPKLVSDTLGRSRPTAHPAHDGVPSGARGRLGPTLEPGTLAGRATGLPVEARVAMAEGVLRAMSLTAGFARLVVLAGHGSSTVNNPHATGLDCGACGGHTGEANARVAAAVLNDPTVRRELPARGIHVPNDTVFLAALHDTTTDEVALYDTDGVPASHQGDLAQLRTALSAAARLARAERAPALKVRKGADLDAQVLARSRDWSQVRPEWGLAGCAAFVAAPRSRTAGRDFGGRTFLHSYEWRQDAGFGVLELILTAPVVVASWISLQYYGSTVDNRAFGSGNKTLHNVVGTVGVLEGNGGDLRTGLPWQSVHDGERFVHEPLRLNVMIEAPTDAMNAVIARHEGVRQLLDNGWLHLWALDDAGRVAARYVGDLTWAPVGARQPGLGA